MPAPFWLPVSRALYKNGLSKALKKSVRYFGSLKLREMEEGNSVFRFILRFMVVQYASGSALIVKVSGKLRVFLSIRV